MREGTQTILYKRENVTTKKGPKILKHKGPQTLQGCFYRRRQNNTYLRQNLTSSLFSLLLMELCP